MNLTRSIIITTVILAFTLDLIYLVIRVALAPSTGAGADVIHSALLMAGFWAVTWLLQHRARSEEQNPVHLIGRLLMLTVGLALAFGVVHAFDLARFDLHAESIAPRDYISLMVGALLTIIATVVSIAILLTLSELIFIKQRKNTKRNFYVLITLLCIHMLVVYFTSPQGYAIMPDYPLAGFSLALVILAMLVNSFRFSWIIFLTRREKFVALMLVFFGMVFSIVLANRIFDSDLFHRAILFIHPMCLAFVTAMLVFAAIYMGIGFVSTLLHLPTAKEFDRKKVEISSLQNMSRLITQVLDFEDLVATSTQLAMDVCEGSIAWMQLVMPGTDESRGRHSIVIGHSLRNITEDTIRSLTLTDGSLLHDAPLETGDMLVVQDFAGDPRHALIRQRFPFIGSMVMIPLRSHSGVMGILCIGKKNPYEFDKEVLNLLVAFADLVAIALENNRLIFESLAQERLKEELRLAKLMQQKLLPRLLPVSPTYEIAARSVPAHEVGGDYYDALDFVDDRMGFIVGDVSGKGVSAALYMAQVKGIFQTLGAESASPRELLVRMNETLWRCMEKSSFVSVLHAVLDFRSGTLRFARAGHCPLLYITHGCATYVRPDGMGLGLDPGERFGASLQEEVLQLGPGDVIVLYTDGVTEARNPEGEEFQFEKLSQTVLAHQHDPVDAILQTVIDTVLEHTSNHAPDDDLTVLVLRWNGERMESAVEHSDDR